MDSAPVPATEPATGPARHPDEVLRLIALFKFCKAALMIGVVLGALEMLRPGVALRAQEWAALLVLRSDRRFVVNLLSRVSGLTTGRLELVGAGAFVYAALFLVEGVGLWRARRWAEYLTVVASLLLVPVEVVELVRRVTPERVAALVINLVVVAYLVYVVQRQRQRRVDSRP